jgi:hypothetical protein
MEHAMPETIVIDGTFVQQLGVLIRVHFSRCTKMGPKEETPLGAHAQLSICNQVPVGTP